MTADVWDGAQARWPISLANGLRAFPGGQRVAPISQRAHLRRRGDVNSDSTQRLRQQADESRLVSLISCGAPQLCRRPEHLVVTVAVSVLRCTVAGRILE